MAILKLQNEGDFHTMAVTECKEVAGNYGPQVLFSDGTDTLYLPKESADRQLTRMGLDYASAQGMTLTFSRDPNPKKGAKPYWGISYAGTDAPVAKPTPRVEAAIAPSGTSNTLENRRDKVLANYLMLWDAMALHLAQTSKKYGYALDAAAIQAAAATVWISWKDKGIQPDGSSVTAAEPPPVVKMPAPSGKRLAPPELPPANPADDDLPF